MSSISFSKAAKYLFGSSTSTSISTSSALATDVTIDSERERKKEEKSRRQYSRQLNEAGKDEEYNDQAVVSTLRDCLYIVRSWCHYKSDALQ